jgi:hypothetical protein
MVLTIDLAPELESRLREAAADQGIELRTYVEEYLCRHLCPTEVFPPRLSDAESRLFEEINHGFSEADWNRYGQLIGKRRAEQLTAGEHLELTSLSDRLEGLNVRRLELLGELARLRNTTLRALIIC